MSKPSKYDPPARLATRLRDDVPLFRCLLARERGTHTRTRIETLEGQRRVRGSARARPTTRCRRSNTYEQVREHAHGHADRHSPL